MIDIVARLRSMLACDPGCEGRCYDCLSTVAKEAADEIEWLRGERNRLAADLAKAHLDIVAWIKKAQEALT